MIIKLKPQSKTLAPISLQDILFGEEDKDINVIENIIQRELVWPISSMEIFWHDVLECIKINIDGVKNGYFNKVFDKSYMNAGNIEYSVIDNCNKGKLIPLERGNYKSIVDGSQRNRISLFMVLAFMYEIDKSNKKEYMDLSPFKSDNGEYKLMEVGIDKLKKFYTHLETMSISEIAIFINKYTIEDFSKKFKNLDEERNYFDVFTLYTKYIERDIIGTYSIEDSFKIVMNNIYFYEESIDEDSKFDRFVDRNKKGTPMSDESMYPKYIINQYDDNGKEMVYEAFKRAKMKAEEAQIKPHKDGRFRKTKSGLDAFLYIMIESLKISLGTEYNKGKDINLKSVFSSTFDLGNIEYGIEKCFRNELVFNTAKDAVDFFNLCSNIAEFLIKDSFSRHDNIYDDYYYLRDFAKPDVLWWYFIKPSYIANSKYIYKRKRFEFIKKMLYRIYSFYIVHRGSGDTNSQNLINLLENISALMITFMGEDEDFEKIIRSEVSKYISNAGGYDILYATVYGLSYTHNANRNAIENVFIAMEYDLCEKYDIDTSVFYGLWKRKNGKPFNLDHWLPENKFKDKDNWVEYHQIGNLVLLEESLNKSKQDEMCLNSQYYTQSNYVQTKLFSKKNRGPFPNKILDSINNYPYFLRVDEEILNNPSIEEIRERTKKLATFFVDFIKNFVENNE